MLTQLLDESYINLKPLIIDWSGRFGSSGYVHSLSVIAVCLDRIYRGMPVEPFKFESKLIDSEESFTEICETHSDLLEKFYLIEIFNRTFRVPNVQERVQFQEMSLSQKVSLLGITSYLEDRNVMDLYMYARLLRLEAEEEFTE